jgi:hypothetical protein
MNAFWAYFWPPIAACIVIGAITGLFALRARILPPAEGSRERRVVKTDPRKRRIALSAGLALSIGVAGLWHGPLGAAGHFSADIERTVRLVLDNWEMTQVDGRLHHAPLTRHILLSGKADDFQRSELAQMIGNVPGVERASWSASDRGLPLIVEGAAAAVLGFLFGLLLAYLLDLRRRYNAQWNW